MKTIVLQLNLDRPLTDEDGEVPDFSDREDFWGSPGVKEAFQEMALAEAKRRDAESAS